MANYLIKNSYACYTDIKDAGGKFDKDLKGWIVNQEQLDLLQKRSDSRNWSMSFSKSWAKVLVEQIAA